MNLTHQLNDRSLIGAGLALLFSIPALAQLTPDRTYYGISRPVPMLVKTPAGEEANAKIELYLPGAEKPHASAPVVPGGVDVAALFPDLWTSSTPRLVYAQLVAGEEKIGAPVVLQPLTPPPTAVLNGKNVEFQPGQGRYSGLRAYVDQQVVFETDHGSITFQLRPDEAPNTAWNFRSLVAGGFYTDIEFHRIIGPTGQRPGFMAQVGDPTGSGSGGPGYVIDLEPSRLPHAMGVLSMARTRDPNTNGSQVFICFSREGTQFLDGGYCAFAQAVDGVETLARLQAVPVVDNGQGEISRPSQSVKLRSARLVDAPPFGAATRKAIVPPAAEATPR